MVHERNVSISLTDELLSAIGHAALKEGCSPSDWVRQALRRATGQEIGGRVQDRRARLTQIAAEACNWLELQAALRRSGFVLRDAPGVGLRLHSWPENRALAPAAAFGIDQSALTLRFRRPFPGSGIAAPEAATPVPVQATPVVARMRRPRAA